MIRKYHTLVGRLVANVASDSTVLQIDHASAQKIAADFQNGEDLAYFSLSTSGTYEVVKAIAIDGDMLSVQRGQDDTTPAAFPMGTTFAYVLCADGVLVEFLENGGGNATIDLVPQGLVHINHPGADTYQVNVEVPNFQGEGGIEVFGSWPDITIVYNGGQCCGGGSSGGGSGGDFELQTSGIINGYYNGSTLFLGVDEPQFNGVGVDITGSWPYYTFQVTGGGGSVSGVGAGAGITVTGNPNVNPTISVANTGVAGGTYGDVQINARGQFVYVPPTFNPISAIVSADGSIIITREGGAVTIDMQPAQIGVQGAVALADHTEDFDPTDETNAATPAVVAKALTTFAVPELSGSSNFTSEADGDYTNALGGTATAVVLEAGEKALVIAEATMVDLASPLTPVAFGLAVFNAVPAKVRGNKKVTQSQQSMTFVLEGPINSALSVATTPPGTATVVSFGLTVIKF